MDRACLMGEGTDRRLLPADAALVRQNCPVKELKVRDGLVP